MQFRDASVELIRRAPYVLRASPGLRRRFGTRGLAGAMEFLALVRERRAPLRGWFSAQPRCRACGVRLREASIPAPHELRVDGAATDGAVSITGPTFTCRCGTAHFAAPDVAMELALDWLSVCEGWPEGVVPVPHMPARGVHVEHG